MITVYIAYNYIKPSFIVYQIFKMFAHTYLYKTHVGTLVK